MFKITSNKGFQITFENKITVSVQFGIGNYCDKKDEGIMGSEKLLDIWEAKTAEVAVWDVNNTWLDIQGNQVKGWVNPSELIKLLSIIESSNSFDELQKNQESIDSLDW